MTNTGKGDDHYYNRLLSYFQSQFTERITRLVPFRQSVIMLETVNETYVIKGYHSYRKLRLQETFTTTLRKEGFLKTYKFIAPPVREQLYFEGTYFGCTDYIKPHKKAFSFQSEKNRQEGLDLLEQFHKVTAVFEKRYRTLLPKGQLVEKWTDRLEQFSANLPFLKHFIHESYLLEMLSWARYSLDGMSRNSGYFLKGPHVILHGDVAHHNYLRDTKGQLHLIDFDLISIGNKTSDYLQYANRIFPYLNWSLSELSVLKQMRPFLKEEAFLYALVYPADIFREWNRIVRENSYTEKDKITQVMDLTIGQFNARKNLADKIKAKLA